jgi:RNA polymerase sigma factor (sigma-70 family)
MEVGQADNWQELRGYTQLAERVCRRHTRSQMDAEDAAQETLQRFVSGDMCHVSNPEAWLTAVAKRCCADLYRRGPRKHEDTVGLVPDLIDHHDPAELVAESSLVGGIMNALSPRDQHLLELLYVEDLTTDDVAKRFGTSVAHVRVLASRARERARSAWEDIRLGVSNFFLTSSSLRNWLSRRTPSKNSSVITLNMAHTAISIALGISACCLVVQPQSAYSVAAANGLSSSYQNLLPKPGTEQNSPSVVITPSAAPVSVTPVCLISVTCVSSRPPGLSTAQLGIHRIPAASAVADATAPRLKALTKVSSVTETLAGSAVISVMKKVQVGL